MTGLFGHRGMLQAMLLLLAPWLGACSTDDHVAALAKADLAAALGEPEQQEALLVTVAMRLERQRTRACSRAGHPARGGHLPPSRAPMRALYGRLAELYEGPLNEPKAAVAAWQHVLSLGGDGPTRGRAYLALGQLYSRRLGERLAAARCYVQAADALGALPAGGAAALLAAELELTLHRPQAAKAAAERVLAAFAGTTMAREASLLLAEASLALGDEAQALRGLREQLGQWPQDALTARGLAQLARLYQAHSEHALALETYQAALGAHDNAPMVQDAIARLSSQMEQLQPHRFVLQGTSSAPKVARR